MAVEAQRGGDGRRGDRYHASLKKMEDGLRLGATHYYATGGRTFKASQLVRLSFRVGGS